MSNAVIGIRPFPFIVCGLPLKINWDVHGDVEGTTKLVLVSLEHHNRISEFANNVEIQAKNAMMPDPEIDLDPGLYMVALINQTNVDQILATSNSFHFAPITSPRTMDMMASLDGPWPNTAQTRPSGVSMPYFPPVNSGGTRSIDVKVDIAIGVSIAAATLFLVFGIILWWTWRLYIIPRNSRRDANKHLNTSQNETAIHPFRQFQPSSSTPSVRNKASANSLSAQSTVSGSSYVSIASPRQTHQPISSFSTQTPLMSPMTSPSFFSFQSSSKGLSVSAGPHPFSPLSPRDFNSIQTEASSPPPPEYSS